MTRALSAHALHVQELAKQREWVGEHGSTLEGYRKRYARLNAQAPDQVEAIFNADIQFLRELEELAAPKTRKQRAINALALVRDDAYDQAAFFNGRLTAGGRASAVDLERAWRRFYETAEAIKRALGELGYPMTQVVGDVTIDEAVQRG